MDYASLEIDRNFWREQHENCQKKLNRLRKEIRECPELNMNNYNEDDVRKLNDWAIYVHNIMFPLEEAEASGKRKCWKLSRMRTLSKS